MTTAGPDWLQAFSGFVKARLKMAVICIVTKLIIE